MTLEHYTYDAESTESIDLYAEIQSWAEDCFPIPEMLPKMGVVVKDEEKPIVFLCADMSNSIPRAFLDFMQTNPKAHWRKRMKAVKMAVSFLCERLREHGFSEVLAITPHAGVASLSQSLGFGVEMKPHIFISKAL